jgi:energy-coupling factor transporter ATP-binding protein EcfA2
MELSTTSKIPWKLVDSPKKLDKVNSGFSKKEIIATFNNNKNFVYLKEKSEKKRNIRDIPPEKLKEMLINGDDDMIYFKEEENMEDDNQRFDYTDKDVMFMPTLTKERELLYIFGPSGSGKSFLSKKYAILYKKYKKGNDVFVLSHVKNDKSFDGMTYKHIPVEKEILENVDLETLADSLVIFDDTDSRDKELQKMVDSLKDDIAQRGRHHNISAIFTTHMACNFLRTRVLLSECDKFIVFPGSGGKKQQEYMVVNYGGMAKSFFNSLGGYKSRWMMFNVRYPNYIVHDHGVQLLS